MKKPTIELLHQDMPTDKLVVNGGMVEVDQAYSDMIDALIEARDTLTYLGGFKDTSTVKQVNIIDKALKAAGCTDEKG